MKAFKKSRFFELLPYESYDPESGLFLNRGSVGFVLKGHPLVGANLEDQDRLADFLKEEVHLPEGSSLQVLLVASPLIGPLLDYWKAHRRASPVDQLAQRRVDFLSGYAHSNTEGQLLRDFRLYISYSLPLSHVTSVQENQVIETRRALKEALLSMGLYTSEMDGSELIQAMSAPLVVIETDHLRNHPDLMAVLVQMMILQINQTMATSDRRAPFLIMIDEAWKLLQGKDSAAHSTPIALVAL